MSSDITCIEAIRVGCCIAFGACLGWSIAGWLLGAVGIVVDRARKARPPTPPPAAVIVLALAVAATAAGCGASSALDLPPSARVAALEAARGGQAPPDLKSASAQAGVPADLPMDGPDGECATPDTPEPVPQARDLDSGWLTVAYTVDSREDLRTLSFEGSSEVTDYLTAYGALDLHSSLDTDPSRFVLRSGVFGRVLPAGGMVAWYEDFTGSSNSDLRFGVYGDVSNGGDRPFCRLLGLPVATDGKGPMVRAMFDVALHRRWSLGGFAEVAWDDDDSGTWVAAEPELRYELMRGKLWATLEYRRDERWEDDEGLALGLRARL